MLKGFVSGEEKDIKRIPMKGNNLCPNTGWRSGQYRDGVWETTNTRSTSDFFHVSSNQYRLKINAGQLISFINFNYFDNQKQWLGNRTTLGMSTFSPTAQNIVIPQLPSNAAYMSITIRFYNDNGNPPIPQSFIDDSNVMVSEGTSEQSYEPYGYQEGWEVRDNQDRILWGREDELQTATGTLPFKGYSLPLKVKSLLGNAVQNGTPTPDNIIMPEMCGVRTGNLVDSAIVKNGYYGGTVQTYSTFTADTRYRSFQMRLKAGTYTLRISAEESIRLLRVSNDIDGPVDVQRDNTPYTFTLSQDTSIYVSFRNRDTTDSFINLKIMLNLGSTNLPYEPFGYKIPLTNAGQTLPVYLGEVPTVRRIKKLVLTGEENWTFGSSTNIWIGGTGAKYSATSDGIICSHFEPMYRGNTNGTCRFENYGRIAFHYEAVSDVEEWKSYLASEYAAGTPVTIWYVLNESETTISNEPLAKIGDYADELTTIQVHGLSAPLYGIGDYKDTLNLSTGVVTRKVKRLVLDGTEGVTPYTGYGAQNCFFVSKSGVSSSSGLCDTYINVGNLSSWINTDNSFMVSDSTIRIHDGRFSTPVDFQSFLQQQYAAGTPVTVWYVLSTPETETVTVPTGMTGEIEGYLTQVSTPTPTNRSVPKWNGVEETGGTYAVTVYTPPEIPTTTGQNTLTVDTDLSPSNLTVKGHIKELT